MTNFDPISQDPPLDAANPPTNMPVQIPSGDDNMLGVFFAAQGAGTHPTILLLHGFPGNERNFDLAQILRRAGYNVLVFHYRGAWGSGGTFSFTHVLEDSRAALNFVRDLPGVDASRLILMGHSMGAWSSLMNAVDAKVIGAAAIAVWNIPAFVEHMPQDQPQAILDWLGNGCAPLRIDSVQALYDDMLANVEAWDLRKKDFAGKAILLIAGEEDEDTPDIIHHTPLVRAYTNARLTYHTIDHADHAFAGQRIELARKILEWLSTL